LGRGCTRHEDRFATSLGSLKEAAARFENCLDVSHGGVLLALPALISNGLFYNSGTYFQLPNGYYGLNSVFIILAFLALLRIKSLEGVRYLPAGELGKLVGLDRIPEVKTLREKVDVFSNSGNVDQWHNDLSRYWMESSPALSGYLYVDGHVRVYHGNQTRLPRRYVSRERLCLRGMTDYWVNDALGQPFFVVTTALTSGLIAMLRGEIIPRLLKDVPDQPSKKALEEDLYLHRFVLLFDREGYSPNFFEEIYFKHRIACITYNKYPGTDWPEDEFKKEVVRFKNGEEVEMLLAERKRDHSDMFWIREIRKLNKCGHQTSILSTNFKAGRAEIAGAMFKRWSQENFFKYMLEHYGIDRLIEYETEPMPDTARVVNPKYRELDSQIRKHNSKLIRLQAEFGENRLLEIGKPDRVKEFEEKMAELQTKIEAKKAFIRKLKDQKKEHKKHITFDQLPENERFRKLASQKKHFIDTIKMIAYRAETSMANVIRNDMVRKDEARSIIRQIFSRDANLIPDKQNKILAIELHNLTNLYEDKLAQIICQNLNATETVFPGTNLKMFYKLVSEKNLRSQEV
jgi:hypothetical protein